MAKINIDTFYPYPVDLVWDAIADGKSMAQWLMENDFQPKVGHKFQFRAKPQPGWDGIVNCEVLKADKPQCLSYSWAGGKGHQTVVTWTLTKVADGTKLQLEHTGFKGVGGFILSKLMLGPGWKKMMTKYLPTILAHIKGSGLSFPNEKLIAQKCEK